MIDYYEILQVHLEAETDVIQAAYHCLSKKYHPDTNRSPEAHDRMTLINAAYEVLSNPVRRAAYDREWSRSRQSRLYTRLVLNLLLRGL